MLAGTKHSAQADVEVNRSNVKDIIPMMVLDRCPYEVGQYVTGPLSDSRRSHIGFPRVGEIIAVEKEDSRFGESVRYHVKLEVALPDRE